jgi:hypothetical protein
MNLVCLSVLGIMIRLPDWELWIGTAKAGIPNVCVLEELVHQIIG